MAKQFKAGINHIEIWVSNVKQTAAFYAKVLPIIGWQQVNERAFATAHLEILLTQSDAGKADSLGVRHICFQARSRAEVDTVADALKEMNTGIIRGPKEMPYTEAYYTVDFKDPDGMVLEVAHTPNMHFPGANE